MVVDDSIVFREVLSKGISSDFGIEVIATASNPLEARDKIIEFQPDVMTCDVEMPRMNGIEFIRQLMPQYPLPIIVVSSISGAVFDAIDAGAVDFVVKPDITSVNSVENFILELITKVKIASVANVLDHKKETVQDKIKKNLNVDKGRIIAIGASTGGTEAICRILKALPVSTPGIVIVQHIPPVFSHKFAERLNEATSLNVREAKSGDYVENGHVLIAPGDQHMKIKKLVINTKFSAL